MRVWGSGFGVEGLGFRVWDSGFEVWGLGFGVWSFRFQVWGVRLRERVYGIGFKL